MAQKIDIDLLGTAVRNGDVNEVRKILSRCGSCNVDSVSINGQPLLHYACSNDQIGVVRVLISEFQANVNCTDAKWHTPLHCACMKGNIDMVRSLISEFQADLNCTDTTGWTPLHHACKKMHTDVVQVLVSEFQANVECTDASGHTPLHYACINGLTYMAKVLCEFQANVNCKDITGHMPLHYACRKGYEDVVRILCEFQVNINCVDPNGWTPLHHACMHGYTDMVEVLSDFQADVYYTDTNGHTPLHCAIINGHTGVLRILISKFQANVNFTDPNGQTLLHYACINGRTDMVKMLCEYQAKVNCADANRQTPLHHACINGFTDIVKILTELQADFSCADKNGQTPLHHACIKGLTDIVRILSELLADFNCADEDGHTPLHYVYVYGHADVLEVFISSPQGNVNFKDTNGQTPLHHACIHKHTDMIKMLLSEFHADVNCRDISGKTPLHYACLNEQYDMVRLLCDFSANVDSEDRIGRTPLHYACIEGYKDIVRMLVSEFHANTNYTDTYMQTPLQYAHEKKFRDVVKIVLSGSNSILANDVAAKLMYDAAFCHKPDMVKLVISKSKLDLNVCKDDLGRTLLHVACTTGDMDLVRFCRSKHVSPLVVDNNGDTPLHTSASLSKNDCVEALLEINAPIMVKNDSGDTPIDVATESTRCQLDYYIRRHRDRIHAYYENIQRSAKWKYSKAEPITRVFVVGNPGAGKSSLVETLKRDSFLGSFIRVSESSVPLHTAGIVPSIHTSKHYGRVLFYDFAGDAEYYSSHAAILENLAATTKGGSIFIIVIDLREDNARIDSLLNYWVSFIHYQKFRGEKPAFILVGSHADSIASRDVALKAKHLKQMSTKLQSKYSHQIAFFYFDCRNPRHVGDLQKHIAALTKGSPHYKLSHDASMLLGVLEVDFSNVTACSLETLVSHIEDTCISLPTQAQYLYSVLLELHDIGLLFVIQSKKDNNLQIILNISKFTNIVHHLLFSKDSFNSKNNVSSFNIGLIPESILEEVLPKYITKQCLIQLQYCQQISHKDLDVFPSISSSDSTDQSFLFFPALCKADKSAMTTPSGLSYSIGWLAECTDPSDYFPPRFLHVLFLRLVVRFTVLVPASSNTPAEHTFFQRCCTMWKTGVHWLMKEGVECMVELVDTSKKLVVIVKSIEEVAETSCLTILNNIISCIMKAKGDFCHAIRPSFFLLDSTNESDYLSEDNRFAISSVEEALTSSPAQGQAVVLSVNGKRHMKVSKILCLQKLTHWYHLFPMEFFTVLSCLEDVAPRDLFMLGLHLNLSHSVLESIEFNFPRDIDRQRRELVKKWMSSKHLPCWYHLVKALKEIKMAALAEKLEDEHSESLKGY